MKRKVAVGICLFAVVGVWLYVHAQTTVALKSPEAVSLPTGSSGRYQVIAVETDYPNWREDNIKSKTAIKLDTQTGRSWILTEYKDSKGEPHLNWIERSQTQ